jgi:hypothetical protein
MWSGAGRCGERWLLADGHYYGSRSGYAKKYEAKHFADAREVAERAAAQAGPEHVVTVGQLVDRAAAGVFPRAGLLVVLAVH